MSSTTGCTSSAGIALLRQPEEEEAADQRDERPADADVDLVGMQRRLAQQAPAGELDVAPGRVEMQGEPHPMTMALREHVDVVEDAGEVEPRPHDEREQRREVGDVRRYPSRHERAPESEHRREQDDDG